jgi:DNA repair protein RadC
MSLSQSWPAGELPREKLLKYGASALTDSELLAIFLRTGIVGKNVMQLAREIIMHFGTLAALFAASESDICAIKGLGKAKFVQLQACLEMSLRHTHEQIQSQDAITNPDQVKQFVQAKLRNHPNEVFAALFLDNQHRVIAFEELFFGTINASSVHPRVLVQRSMYHNAAAIIVTHNHPSGVAEPSPADIDITNTLKSALSLLDIRLLDHLVVASHQVVSLAERGQV